MRVPLWVFLLVTMSASAGQTYVATTGNDANDCLTLKTQCATLQRCADALLSADGMTGSGQCAIADGTYSAGAEVHYYRFVQFVGNCAAPWNVVISTASGVTAFLAQDHVIMAASCMTLETPDGIGIKTRQFAIADYDNIRWGISSPAYAHVVATEHSKINCGLQEKILVGATFHAQAEDGSQLALGCATWINSSQTFDSYVSLSTGSLARFDGAVFSGSGITGYKGTIANFGSVVSTGGVTVPGSSWNIPAGGGQVQ